MKRVGIGELRSRLSECLRALSRGEAISVLDDGTPVAEIVPVAVNTSCLFESPNQARLRPIAFKLPEPAGLNLNIVPRLM